MPYKLSKRIRFEASHQLPEHDGKCANLHGHSWEVVLSVKGDQLYLTGPKAGMLIDYGDIGQVCKDIEVTLDHTHLNDLIRNPTSENLATWIWNFAAGRLSKGGVNLSSVIVRETCNCECEFTFQ